MTIEATLTRVAEALERLNTTAEIMLERNTIALSKSLVAMSDDVSVGAIAPVDVGGLEEPDNTIEVPAPKPPKRVSPSRAKGAQPAGTAPAATPAAGQAEEAPPTVLVSRINGVVQPTPQQEPEAQGATATATDITLEQINSELQRYVQVEGKSGSAVMEILGAYHASRSLRNIDPVHYAEILTRVEAL